MPAAPLHSVRTRAKNLLVRRDGGVGGGSSRMEPAAIPDHIVQMLVQQTNASLLKKGRVAAQVRDVIMAAAVPPASTASADMAAPFVCTGIAGCGRRLWQHLQRCPSSKDFTICSHHRSSRTRLRTSAWLQIKSTGPWTEAQRFRTASRDPSKAGTGRLCTSFQEGIRVRRREASSDAGAGRANTALARKPAGVQLRRHCLLTRSAKHARVREGRLSAASNAP